MKLGGNQALPLSFALISMACAPKGSDAHEPLAAAVTSSISNNPDSMRHEAAVGEPTAGSLALRAIPGSIIKATDIKRVEGKLVWSFELSSEGKIARDTVVIDATTGAVVSNTRR